MTNANGNKGKEFERAVCAYLRPLWPEVDRTVVAGYRTADRVRADAGDVHFGTPELPVIVQAKDVTGSFPRGLANKKLDDLLAETRAQRDAAGAVLGLLVEKRGGFASAGDAWVHLDALELYVIIDGWQEAIDACRLIGAHFTHLDEHGRVSEYSCPVRLRFGDLVALMVAGGFCPEQEPVR
jgi:hypothetical protein